MRKYKIVFISVWFYGIYQWGSGWSEEMAEKWHTFWRNHKGGHWRFYESKDGTLYLHDYTNQIYLHPDETNAVLHYDSDNFYEYLLSLKQAMDDCASFCGGRAKMHISDPVELIMKPNELKIFNFTKEEWKQSIFKI